MVIIEGTAEGIAQLIAESSDTGHLRNVGLDTELFGW